MVEKATGQDKGRGGVGRGQRVAVGSGGQDGVSLRSCSLRQDGEEGRIRAPTPGPGLLGQGPGADAWQHSVAA